MEKVITIDSWYDGRPLLGIAYFNQTVCIYERIFDNSKDDYIDEYYLTPVTDCEKNEIMLEWQEWCSAVSAGNPDTFYKKYLNRHSVSRILDTSDSKRKYRKKARFSGQFDNGYIPVDYSAEWYD